MAVQAARGRRWTVLALLLVVSLMGYCVRLLWSNAAIQVGADLAMSPAMTGFFVSAFYGGYIVSSFVGGFLVDRLGSRASLTTAILCLALFTSSFGLVRTPAEGLAVQFLMGMSAGVFFAADAKAIVQWFAPPERGLAFGLLGSPSSLGLIVTNLVFPPLLQAWPWTQVYFVVGLATTLLAAAAFLVLQDSPAREAGPRPKLIADTARSAGEILRSRDMQLMTIAGFCGNWGTWGFVFWAVPLMVMGKGLTALEAAQVMGLVGLGAVITKPAYGFLSDLFRERKLFVSVCLLAFAAILLLFASLEEVSAFRLLAPVLGFVAFAYSPLIGTMFSERASPHRVGAVTGFAHAVTQVANVAAPAVVGIAFGATGSFAAAVALMACGPLCAAGAMLLVRSPDPVRASAR